MKKLIKEFFVSEDETLFEAFQETNLYTDLLSEESSIDGEYGFDWVNDINAQKVINKFRPLAQKLSDFLKKSKRRISKEEAREIDWTIYDGSDAYDGTDIYSKAMPDYYNNQAKLLLKLSLKLSKSKEWKNQKK